MSNSKVLKMKFAGKIIFILILLILLTIIPAYALTVDESVEEKLEKDDEVSVIVLLKDKSINQNDVLSTPASELDTWRQSQQPSKSLASCRCAVQSLEVRT